MPHCERASNHAASADATASHTSLTNASTSARSSASAMTRITGSVPDGRMTRRPWAPSLAVASAIAFTTGADSSGRPPLNRTLRSIWGRGSKRWQISLTGLFFA